MQPKKKIVHITFAPMTNYLGQGLQIDNCIENNFEVAVLDISKILGFPAPEHSSKYITKIIPFDSFKQLENYIHSHSPEDIFINVQMSFEWRFRNIFRLIAKNSNYKWGIFFIGQLPFYAAAPMWKKIFKSPLHQLPGKILTRILSKLLFKAHYFQNQGYIFYAGIKQKPNIPEALGMPINYFDYDSFLETSNDSNSSIEESNYIVFLDEGLFQHPDDIIVGNIIEAGILNSYRESLVKFFDFIESETGFKIIVAAHPKVNHRKDFFGNRTIYQNKTRELVEKSEFVLCHCSSSVSFAVCYKKPMFFLTSKSIIEFSKNNQQLNESIHNFARELGRPVINIDELLQPFQKSSLMVNHETYKRFAMDYLTTPETENIPTKKIIIEYLLQILK